MEGLEVSTLRKPWARRSLQLPSLISAIFIFFHPFFIKLLRQVCRLRILPLYAWAAGVKASKMGQVLRDRAGAELDRAGRVMVKPDLSLKKYSDIYVIGDLSHYAHQSDRPLPGIAPVAMQQGSYVAKAIQEKLKGNRVSAFRYINAGKLAVIGQNSAVVDLGYLRLSGFLAWLIWVFAHIYYLIEFDNKLGVMVQWGWNYFTRGRGARLITGEGLLRSLSLEVENKH